MHVNDPHMEWPGEARTLLVFYSRFDPHIHERKGAGASMRVATGGCTTLEARSNTSQISRRFRSECWAGYPMPRET